MEIECMKDDLNNYAVVDSLRQNKGRKYAYCLDSQWLEKKKNFSFFDVNK